MTLQSIYNKGKGKSTIGIVKDILEEACWIRFPTYQ
jgi:hypothetical protein